MAAKKKVTEAQMLELLKTKLSRSSGNGPEHAFIPHVKSDAGHGSHRTIDAISMSLWISRGLLISGYEIKCSRSDWLTELKSPEKAEEFFGFIDRFYLVISDPEIVQPGELPEGWGLLCKKGRGLTQLVEPKLFREDTGPLPPQFFRGFLAALLRSACRQRDVTPKQIEDAMAAAAAEAKKEALTYEQTNAIDWYDAVHRIATQLAEKTGARGKPSVAAYSYMHALKDPEVLQLALDHREVKTGRARLENEIAELRRKAPRFAKQLREAADLLDPPTHDSEADCA